MNELLERIRRLIAGGQRGEELDPRVTGEAPGFVRDTALAAFGMQPEDVPITGVPGLQTRAAEAMLGGEDQILGQVPMVGNVFVSPRQPIEEQEATAGHEIFHEVQNSDRFQALQRQLAEMFELAKSRDDRSLVERIRDRVTMRMPSHLENQDEHGADAVEAALRLLRSEPGQRTHQERMRKLRTLEQEVPGTALAFNFLQRRLQEAGANRVARR